MCINRYPKKWDECHLVVCDFIWMISYKINSYLSYAYPNTDESNKLRFEQRWQSSKSTYLICGCSRFRMFVPPLELQEQFAAFVEQTDKSKSVVQKALDEAQLLFDSLMQQYFG